MASSATSRPRRTKRTRSLFEPPGIQEEHDLQRALQLSMEADLVDPDVSEDEKAEESHSDSEEEEVTNGDEMDEKHVEEGSDPGWNEVCSEFDLPRFESVHGASSTVRGSVDPIKFFDKFFTPQVWSHLVQQTNLYAKQYLDAFIDEDWQETNEEELKALVGMLIGMGICYLPRQRMYWEDKWRVSMVAKVMSRNRYLKLMKYLHINDNDRAPARGDPNYNVLYKIQPLLDMLGRNFRSEFVPGANIVLDEDMIPYKGRMVIKQYMKDKPIKWGYKVFKLCDAETAYVYRLQIYTGKQDRNVDGGLSYAVSMAMVEGLTGQNRTLYCDNWYTGVKLFKDLRAKGTSACGTVRTNRKEFPSAVAQVKKLERGESYSVQRDHMVASVWYDKRPVYLLSTAHNATGPHTVRRHTGSGNYSLVPCPPALKAYTTHMGAVDRSDRLSRQYTISRKSKKWWKRMFFYLVDTSISNAFILYDLHPGRHRLSMLQFRESLIEALCRSSAGQGDFRGPNRPPAGDGPGPGRYHNLSHWPKHREKKGDCAQCSDRKHNRVRSNYVCERCKVALCVAPCFKNYHVRRNG